MYYLKKFNEFYVPSTHANFIAGGNVSFSNSTANTAGIFSQSVAGAGGKRQQAAGPISFGPDAEEYENVLKNIEREKLPKKKKKKKISRDHPGAEQTTSI